MEIPKGSDFPVDQIFCIIFYIQIIQPLVSKNKTFYQYVFT